jgi:hypothetical protein
MSKSKLTNYTYRGAVASPSKSAKKVLDFERRFIDALKVLVAPKVGLLPQKSFRSVIPFADHDLSAAIYESMVKISSH